MFSSIFLTGIILWTKRARLQIFKSSAISTFGAVDDETKSSLGGINDISGMRQRARRLHVRLERASSGVGLWLAAPKDARGVT
jgi:hypothetical protein